jgi:hypothetical protein
MRRKILAVRNAEQGWDSLAFWNAYAQKDRIVLLACFLSKLSSTSPIYIKSKLKLVVPGHCESHSFHHERVSLCTCIPAVKSIALEIRDDKRILEIVKLIDESYIMYQREDFLKWVGVLIGLSLSMKCISFPDNAVNMWHKKEC